jgi:hypothetical protein
MVNKNWGVQETTVSGGATSPQYQFLTITENPNAGNGYTLQYKMDDKIKNTFRDNTGNVSRWVALFGIRYSF